MKGTSEEYAPNRISGGGRSFEISNALLAAAKKELAGVVHVKDAFFGRHNPEKMPVFYKSQQMGGVELDGMSGMGNENPRHCLLQGHSEEFG